MEKGVPERGSGNREMFRKAEKVAAHAQTHGGHPLDILHAQALNTAPKEEVKAQERQADLVLKKENALEWEKFRQKMELEHQYFLAALGPVEDILVRMNELAENHPPEMGNVNNRVHLPSINMEGHYISAIAIVRSLLGKD